MNRLLIYVCVALLSLVAIGCGKGNTPDYVQDIWESAKAKYETHPEALGAHIAEMEELVQRYSKFQVSEEIAKQLAESKAKIPGRYDNSRNLVRRGEFERAEKILKDLAENLADTADGKLAKEYVHFEFYMHAAQQYLLGREYEKGEAFLAKVELENLEPVEKERLHSILDTFATAKNAKQQASAAQFKGACRALFLTLVKHRAHNGSFPTEGTLETLSGLDPRNRILIKDIFSKVEGYKSDGQTFSMTAVGAGGEHTCKITDQGVED
jgi:hypothetical protein